MRSEGILDTSMEAVFNASGVAQAELGPGIYGVVWTITRLVTYTTSTSDTTLLLYRNSESKGNLVNSTQAGNLDTDTDPKLMLRGHEKLIAVWSNGTVGAKATLSIEGTFVR